EFTIDDGECASGGQLAENRSVTTTVDCTEVHDLQVFASAEAFQDGIGEETDYAYPGQALIDWARARCALSFQSELMDAKQREHLRFRALVPSAEQWDATDDNGNRNRTVHCVAYDAEGEQLRETVLAEEEYRLSMPSLTVGPTAAPGRPFGRVLTAMGTPVTGDGAVDDDQAQ